MTEKQIAQQLEVDQSTISRAIKAPKDLSRQFVYDLAKSGKFALFKHGPSVKNLKSIKEARVNKIKSRQISQQII
jgi:IS30 family transposase